MKVTLNADDQIVVDCEGKSKKELKVVYENVGPEVKGKDFERKIGDICVSVRGNSRWTEAYPIRISILNGTRYGLPMGDHIKLSFTGKLPRDILSIGGAKKLIEALNNAISVVENNNELHRN